MLILPNAAVKKLVASNEVEVWSPALDRARTLDVPPADALANAEELFELPEPAANVYHVVRQRYDGETITRAKAVAVRPSTLQSLTAVDAAAAGFQRTADFLEWWQRRHLTTPAMATVPCWVATYRCVRELPPYYMSRAIPGRQGDYTSSPLHAIDDAEAIDAREWVEKNEAKRQLESQQARLLARLRRRAGRKAA